MKFEIDSHDYAEKVKIFSFPVLPFGKPFMLKETIENSILDKTLRPSLQAIYNLQINPSYREKEQREMDWFFVCLKYWN